MRASEFNILHIFTVALIFVILYIFTVTFICTILYMFVYRLRSIRTSVYVF